MFSPPVLPGLTLHIHSSLSRRPASSPARTLQGLAKACCDWLDPQSRRDGVAVHYDIPDAELERHSYVANVSCRGIVGKLRASAQDHGLTFALWEHSKRKRRIYKRSERRKLGLRKEDFHTSAHLVLCPTGDAFQCIVRESQTMGAEMQLPCQRTARLSTRSVATHGSDHPLHSRS